MNCKLYIKDNLTSGIKTFVKIIFRAGAEIKFFYKLLYPYKISKSFTEHFKFQRLSSKNVIRKFEIKLSELFNKLKAGIIDIIVSSLFNKLIDIFIYYRRLNAF